MRARAEAESVGELFGELRGERWERGAGVALGGEADAALAAGTGTIGAASRCGIARIEALSAGLSEVRRETHLAALEPREDLAFGIICRPALRGEERSPHLIVTGAGCRAGGGLAVRGRVLWGKFRRSGEGGGFRLRGGAVDGGAVDGAARCLLLDLGLPHDKGVTKCSCATLQ